MSLHLKSFTQSSLVFLLVSLSSFTTLAQCGCTFTIPAGTGIYTFDGTVKGAKPGDVICLAAGARERLVFQNIVGTPTNVIKIINCGGQSLIGGPNANTAISFAKSKYFRITGTGDVGFNYGIKIVESKAGTQGVHVYDTSTDSEVDHMEITKVGFAGVMAKSDPSKDCLNYSYERPNFTMSNVIIHDNYVHDITGEGIYCGNSFYTGATNFCGARIQYPHEIRGVRIYDNIFENCGWESIQVGCGVQGVEIYRNKIYNYGVANLYAQNGGIQIGNGSVGKVYNNFIKKGTGIAILAQGIGNISIFNNVIVESGTYAILMSMKATPLVTDIVSQGFVGPVLIMNNTIVNPSLNDGVVKESVIGPPGNVIYNNLVVGGQSNWLKLRGDTDWKKSNNVHIPVLADAKFVNPALDDYRLLTGSPAINAGKDVAGFGVTFDFDNKGRPSGAAMDLGAFEFGGNQKPTVSVGANQTLTLPTIATSISGSATDADGSIASYLWTKQSGPTAVLTNATTTTVSISGLGAGVYVFRLTATDDANETGFNDVTVTVVDPSVNQLPVANTGGNKTITLPTSTTILNGSGSDPDGTIVSYAWTKVSALTATLTNSTTNTLTLTGLVQGVHTFNLLVTDDDGGTDSKNVTVTVQAAATNQIPTANTGTDKSLVLPTNSINITGSGADPDGSIASYAWTKQSGPTVTLTNTDGTTLQATAMVLGTYVFRLTVTDNLGATGFDEVTVVVSSSNQAPVAEAGASKTIQLPSNSTTITGSGTDDGSITGYAWSKISGPASGVLANATTSTLTVTSLVQGIYIFRLTVTDNNSATGSDEVTITVQAANVPPTANAGPPKTPILPINSVTLVGSGTDVDGSISSYLWEKVSGSTATLSGAALSTLSVTDLVEGVYSFRLTVTDNGGETGNSLVSVTVFPVSTNQSPIVGAGTPITLTLPTNSITLTGTASDTDGSISTYLWEKVSGPTATLNGTASVSLSLTNLVAGIFSFRFTATDDKGASASADVTVTVTNNNQPPLVNAGSDIVVTLPITTATLTAAASDSDGTIASYLWTALSGPSTPSLTGTSSNALSVNGLLAGTYIFRVTVTDNSSASTSDDVNISVQTATNSSPIAIPGSNITLFLPTNSATLTGSGSDSDGTISSYDWSKIQGGTATLSNVNSSGLSISDLVVDVYTFRLTVTDNAGATGINDVTITVLPGNSNQSPIANAGPSIALSLPVNSTNLIGSGSDVDGTINSYTWVKVSGPSATLSNSNTAVLTLQDLLEGIYLFRITVTDNNGVSSSDDAQVTVLPSSVNQPPAVSAGQNITISLPTNTINLTATASDPDGSIASYVWSKQVGPTATLTGEGTATLSVTDLVEGVYSFRILVTDNKGTSIFDELSLTVLPQGSNQPPVVNAGMDKVLFLPNTSINLNGTASDANGSIASYSWSKLNGPTLTLANESTPNVTLNDLLPGQYLLRLTATDNQGGSSFDEVSVTLFPGTINQSPLANAGSNKTIVLPTVSTTLAGSGFDPDGSIVSYDWTQTSGPTAIIENLNSPTLSIDNLTLGVFQFRLTVVDNSGASGSDFAQITVVEEGFNQPPIADAGFDKVVNLPQSSIEIQGSGADPDGTIASFGWVKKSGPSAGSFTGQTTSKLSLTGLVAGTYQFTLTVVDDKGLSNSDDIRVTVIQSSTNNNPTVDAGADLFIRLPISTTSLVATGSDIDGSIATYFWTKQSGPSAVLSGENTTTLSVSNLVQGTYIFRVEVTDNAGATATNEVTIIVAPPGTNKAPIVSAGSAKSISPPVTSVTLNGSASDTDGSIATLTWTQQSGSTGLLLSGVNSTTLTAQNLTVGSYTFRLTALDNENSSAFSDATVVVKSEPLPPLVIAGNDTTIVLPNSIIPLVGEAQATDGFITEYTWTQIDGLSLEITGDYPDVVLRDLVAGAYAFQLTVTDNLGSKASDDILITVVEGKSNPIGASLFFSPNNDAVNDVWTIKNSHLVEGCPVKIYNSLGKKIFEADQYENDWNGVANGQVAKEGDYYFVFECANRKTYSGALRLIR